MPTYDYVCDACGHALELFQMMSEAPKRKCPSCGASKLRRLIGTGAGVLFKGSGFYQTDYRSDSYKKGESASKPKDDAKPASSEAKPAETKSSSEKGSSKSGDVKKAPKKSE